MKKILIIGASGHGKVVADIARLVGYEKIAFLDDDLSVKECIGFPVIGSTNDIETFSDWEMFIAIGNSKVRKIIFEKLSKLKINIVTLIHPDAVVSRYVKIGIGSVLMAGAVVNPNTEIGKCCIINTCASVDHDNIIGDFSHISVGSHLAGNVSIGEESWIGIGAIISNNISIYKNCIVGAGGVVVNNILESGTYVGVPVKKIK